MSNSTHQGNSSHQEDDIGRLVAATSRDIDAMDWQGLPGQPGVAYKVLWRSDDVVLGIMQLDEGAVNTEHTHRRAHHHILVLSGECTIAGNRLDAGSYIHIPPRASHGVTDVGPGGCRFFYTFRQVGSSLPDAPDAEPDMGHPV